MLFAVEENCSHKSGRFVLDGAFIVIAIMERGSFGVQTEYCMFVDNVYAIHCLHH